MSATLTVLTLACTQEFVTEVPVERNVIIEQPVVKEIPIERLIVVEREVVREVPVERSDRRAADREGPGARG